MAGSCEVTRRSDNTIQTLMCWKRMSKVRSHDQIRAKRRSKLGSTLPLVLSSRFINSNKPKVRRHTISIPCRVSAAFAPYRFRPFEFAPTSYRVRPHTFRVRPHQVEFAPWLSDIQMSWFVSWWVNSSVLMNGYKSYNLSNAAAMKAWFASSQVWLLRSTHFVFVR